MNQRKKSLTELLCNGKDGLCWDVDKMISSLDTHKVSLDEVKSMESELKSKPPLIDSGSILVVLSLFITCFSGYLTNANNTLMSALAIRTSKMTETELTTYWPKHGKAVLKQVSNNSGVLNGISKFIWVILLVLLIVWVYKIFKSFQKQKQLQALHEYERILLAKSMKH